MGAYKLNIGDATHYLKWDGVTLQVRGLISVDNLSAINANLGNITAGNIRGTRLQIGAGTNEDIYFEDSGIRLFDYGSGIAFRKDTNDFFRIVYSDLNVWIITDKDNINFATPTKTFTFFKGGTLGLSILEEAPAAHVAGLTYHSDEGNNPYFHGYIGPPDNCWGKMELAAPNW